MQINIREASSFEVTELASLFLFKITVSNKIFIAKLQTNIVGYIEFFHIFEEAEILNLEVLTKFQNQKIATKLIDYTLNFLTQNKIKNVFLEVRESNNIAKKLYQNFNFKQILIRKNYYKNPFENAIVMKKTL